MKTCKTCHQSKRPPEMSAGRRQCNACRYYDLQRKDDAQNLRKWAKLVGWPVPQ